MKGLKSRPRQNISGEIKCQEMTHKLYPSLDRFTRQHKHTKYQPICKAIKKKKWDGNIYFSTKSL